MSLTTSRLLGYTLSVACVFGFSASLAVAAFPGWGSPNLAPVHYQWRPLVVRSPSVPAASWRFRPLPPNDARRRIAPRYPLRYASRFVPGGWRPFPAAVAHSVYGAPHRPGPAYRPVPPVGRFAHAPAYGPLAYYARPRMPRHPVSPLMQGNRQDAQPLTVAGYRFRPLTERERYRSQPRGKAPLAAPPFAYSGFNPGTGPRLERVPRRYARGPMPPRIPYMPVAFRPPVQFPHPIHGTAGYLPVYGSPALSSFRPGYAALYEGRLSRFQFLPMPTGFRVAHPVYRTASRWPARIGFRPPVWSPAHSPVRHPVAWQARTMSGGSRFASVPAPGGSS